MFDWLKYKKIYFSLSSVLVIVSIFSLVVWRLKLSIEFTGGTNVEYALNEDTDRQRIEDFFQQNDITINSSQTTSTDSLLLRLPPISKSDRQKLTEVSNSTGSAGIILPERLRLETVGPTIGSEMIKKTVYALSLASLLILIWVAYQFKSLKYGVSAILAMLHDSFILLGTFSLLGHFYSAEVDFLFVTALLTTLSFSVHDTIVVFDRIRELIGKDEIAYDVANRALSETMVRSLNNSFTIIFMLTALVLLGGNTIRWFGVALLVGTILGTYSSPFVAVPLLTSWDGFRERVSKFKR